MKIVVTGALGHIGSHLIRVLPDRFPGADIVLLDDLSAQRYSSLFNLPAHGRYRFHEANIRTADLDSIFHGAAIIVHLAAITNAGESFKNQDKVEQVNLKGTERVAQACIRTGAAMIFPSSTSVYGTQAEVVDEECSADELKPQSPYAEFKLRAEHLLQSLAQKQGLRVIICRLGTIFGVSVGMRFHTAVNKFCWQAMTSQQVTVWSTAMHQYRPYLDLTDAVEALTFIIQKELFDGRVYNVVTTNTSVQAITEIIGRFVPDLSIKLIDTVIMNQLSYHVSSQRFQDAGFEYHGDLERGIRQTVELLKGVRSVQSQAA
jgi:nucleoside-diphosphate-sugar epimerase